MTALFNDEIVYDQINLNLDDRAFQYGDGLFETIAIRNKQPRHITFHFDRLKAGCKVLGLINPKRDHLINNLNRIIDINKLDNSTVKLMLWRKATGSPGYSPDSEEINILITSRPVKASSNSLEKVDFAQDVFFSYTQTSRFKTLNSLPYILAAKERKARNLNELIVLNDKGLICECVSSNIFWVKKHEVFTPSLDTGCLDGVMRRSIIELLRRTDYSLQEVKAEKNDILNAEYVFSTNSAGIKVIKSIGSHKFITKSDLLDLIIIANEE